MSAISHYKNSELPFLCSKYYSFLLCNMASCPCTPPYFTIRCSSVDPHKHKLSNVRLNGVAGASSIVASRVENGAPVLENGRSTKDHTRQNIPTKKQMVDRHRQGIITDGGVGYKQTVVIRSYEVGPDKTATLESILNLLQETALNHVWMSGLLSNGFGATHGMMRNNLIWVVSRMQAQIDHYPIWGEVIDIDTWVGASGKNGMRRDWCFRSQATGHVFARATSTWVMMNQQTRRLSKMPEEVRNEISPWFIEKQAIKEDFPEKIRNLDSRAKYINSNLKPKRSDLDMNQHVNNVKYVRWMLETIPDNILESHQLSEITLEYRRECGSSDIVESLCEPDGDGILNNDAEEVDETSLLNGFSLASDILKEAGIWRAFSEGRIRYTHLLQAKGKAKNEEIVRGRTVWEKKLLTLPFSAE